MGSGLCNLYEAARRDAEDKARDKSERKADRKKDKKAKKARQARLADGADD